MPKKEHSGGSSVMKLFIILMSLSTLGFAIAAVVLYTLERSYQRTISIEERALEKLQREAQDSSNIPYHGRARSETGTTGRELPEYLNACARLTDITANIEGADYKTEKRRDYFETRATYRLKTIPVPDLIRFLTRVEGKREDVFLRSLHISRVDYGVNPTICSAVAAFYVFSEKE